jgi:hypothetical protein
MIHLSFDTLHLAQPTLPLDVLEHVEREGR